ncbi:unnamed protein product [Parajaminaea phylloscopi]
MAGATLLNPLASPEQVRLTPSGADGLPRDLEDDLRCWGCILIQRLGTFLLLPQRVSATAQVLFQRFWFVTSMRQFSVQDVSAGSLFLASKVEEHPLRLRDLINVFDYLLQKDRWCSRRVGGGPWSDRRGSRLHHGAGESERKGFEWQPHSYHSSTYHDYRDSIVVHEMQLLKRLGFQLEAQLPYSSLINYLNVLELGRDKTIVQRCWSICTDMLQTPLPAIFPPHLLAVASIYYLSSAVSPPALPHLPLLPEPWYVLFDADLSELRVICAWLLRLYDGREGTASRVREEWGGCVDMGRKSDVRAWLHRQSSNGRPSAVSAELATGLGSEVGHD